MHKYKLYQTAKVWRCKENGEHYTAPDRRVLAILHFIFYLQINSSSWLVHTLLVILYCISHSQEKPHVITQVKSIIYEFNRSQQLDLSYFQKDKQWPNCFWQYRPSQHKSQQFKKKNKPITQQRLGSNAYVRDLMYGKMCIGMYKPL